jgi:hypothetical protein
MSTPTELPAGAMIKNSATSLLLTVCLTMAALACLGYLTSWEAAWRSFGVTPLEPHFYDMHAITDHAVCAAKGFDAYVLNACDPRTPFNYPPIWLCLGFLGIKESDATWLSIVVAVFALAVIVGLSKSRAVADGILIGAAILSPSVLMGVERGNIDLLILALVGGGALFFETRTLGRTVLATFVIGIAGALKLYPFFCIGLVAGFSRRFILFAVGLTIVGSIYFSFISDYVALIRHNTPTTFILSYGYLSGFLGLDHLRTEAGLSAIGLAGTWVPILCCIFVLMAALGTTTNHITRHKLFLLVGEGAEGVSFLFGASIYCGTFMLGTNFIYRLMFLLLCLPQLLDWARGPGGVAASRVILILIMSALWLSGSANGHATFSIAPQFLHWALLYLLAVVIFINVQQRLSFNEQ